jgi:pyruvate dehydrogenase E1 component alpha subunit
MGTSVERTSNVPDIYKLGLGYEMPCEAVDGMDPEAVHNAISKAAAHIRSGKGPYFLEIKTYRYKGHSVSDPGKYRSKDEVKEYKDRDPINVLEKKLIKEKMATEASIKKIKEAVKSEIDQSVKFAEESSFPDASELYTDNYLQDDYPFLT